MRPLLPEIVEAVHSNLSIESNNSIHLCTILGLLFALAEYYPMELDELELLAPLIKLCLDLLYQPTIRDATFVVIMEGFLRCMLSVSLPQRLRQQIAAISLSKLTLSSVQRVLYTLSLLVTTLNMAAIARLQRRFRLFFFVTFVVAQLSLFSGSPFDDERMSISALERLSFFIHRLRTGAREERGILSSYASYELVLDEIS